MSSKINIGDTFGDWVVIDSPYFKVVGKTKPNRCEFAMCRCSCGVEKEVRVKDMKNGKSTKCKDCNRGTGKKYNNKFNKINNEISEIVVTNIKSGEEFRFIFDTEFYNEVAKKYWGIRRSGKIVYLRSSDRKKESERISLHRFVYSLKHKTSFDKNTIIDHKNRNSFDNRISNLNLVTHLENNQNVSIRKDNKSGVRGVHWDKNRKKWVAGIQYNKKRIDLGAYIDKEDAIKARREAEKKYHRYNQSIKEKE